MDLRVGYKCQTGVRTSEPVALSLTDIIHAHTDDDNMCILIGPVAFGELADARTARAARAMHGCGRRVHQTQLAESINMSRG